MARKEQFLEAIPLRAHAASHISTMQASTDSQSTDVVPQRQKTHANGKGAQVHLRFTQPKEIQ